MMQRSFRERIFLYFSNTCACGKSVPYLGNDTGLRCSDIAQCWIKTGLFVFTSTQGNSGWLTHALHRLSIQQPSLCFACWVGDGCELQHQLFSVAETK